MITKEIHMTLEVPEGTSEADRAAAELRAREAAVLSLWENEALSTRAAAERLGLAYGEFLDLLAARGIPVERGPLATEAIEAAARQLAGKSA